MTTERPFPTSSPSSRGGLGRFGAALPMPSQWQQAKLEEGAEAEAARWRTANNPGSGPCYLARPTVTTAKARIAMRERWAQLQQQRRAQPSTEAQMAFHNVLFPSSHIPQDLLRDLVAEPSPSASPSCDRAMALLKTTQSVLCVRPDDQSTVEVLSMRTGQPALALALGAPVTALVNNPARDRVAIVQHNAVRFCSGDTLALASPVMFEQSAVDDVAFNPYLASEALVLTAQGALHQLVVPSGTLANALHNPNTAAASTTRGSVCYTAHPRTALVARGGSLEHLDMRASRSTALMDAHGVGKHVYNAIAADSSKSHPFYVATGTTTGLTMLVDVRVPNKPLLQWALLPTSMDSGRTGLVLPNGPVAFATALDGTSVVARWSSESPRVLLMPFASMYGECPGTTAAQSAVVHPEAVVGSLFVPSENDDGSALDLWVASVNDSTVTISSETLRWTPDRARASWFDQFPLVHQPPSLKDPFLDIPKEEMDLSSAYFYMTQDSVRYQGTESQMENLRTISDRLRRPVLGDNREPVCSCDVKWTSITQPYPRSLWDNKHEIEACVVHGLASVPLPSPVDGDTRRRVGSNFSRVQPSAETSPTPPLAVVEGGTIIDTSGLALQFAPSLVSNGQPAQELIQRLRNKWDEPLDNATSFKDGLFQSAFAGEVSAAPSVRATPTAKRQQTLRDATGLARSMQVSSLHDNLDAANDSFGEESFSLPSIVTASQSPAVQARSMSQPMPSSSSQPPRTPFHASLGRSLSARAGFGTPSASSSSPARFTQQRRARTGFG